MASTLLAAGTTGCSSSDPEDSAGTLSVSAQSSTAGSSSSSISTPAETESSALPLPTMPGRVTISVDERPVGDLDVTCAGGPTGVFLSTANIDMDATDDGGYTNYLVPDDQGDFLYLIYHDVEPLPNYLDFGPTPWSSDDPDLAYQAEVHGTPSGGDFDYADDVSVQLSGAGSLGGVLHIDEDGSLTQVEWSCG